MSRMEKQTPSPRAQSGNRDSLKGQSPSLKQQPSGNQGKRPDSSPTPSPNAILSPAIDFLCCGGISIAAVIAIFVYAFFNPKSEFLTQGIGLIWVGVLGTLFNAPHFMASYPLLYGKRTQITEHRLASTYVPLILLGIILCAFLTPGPDATYPRVNTTVLEVITIIGPILLAWHYTGQAWGMTGAFAYIRGIRMDRLERSLVRCGYYALLVWHVLWTCLYFLKRPESNIAKNFVSLIPKFNAAYNIWSAIVLLTIPVGIAGFIRIRRRTGITPSLRCYSPWVAIYLWYTLIWAYPGMFALLQIFHALQYLVFPLRIEANQYSAKRKRSGIKQFLHGAGYYLVLVVVGVVVFELLPDVTLIWGDKEHLKDLVAVTSAVTASFVNIHHYFIDGAIWKIRNPQVRRDLFAHLKVAT